MASMHLLILASFLLIPLCATMPIQSNESIELSTGPGFSITERIVPITEDIENALATSSQFTTPSPSTELITEEFVSTVSSLIYSKDQLFTEPTATSETFVSKQSLLNIEQPQSTISSETVTESSIASNGTTTQSTTGELSATTTSISLNIDHSFTISATLQSIESTTVTLPNEEVPNEILTLIDQSLQSLESQPSSPLIESGLTTESLLETSTVTFANEALSAFSIERDVVTTEMTELSTSENVQEVIINELHSEATTIASPPEFPSTDSSIQLNHEADSQFESSTTTNCFPIEEISPGTMQPMEPNTEVTILQSELNVESNETTFQLTAVNNFQGGSLVSNIQAEETNSLLQQDEPQSVNAYSITIESNILSTTTVANVFEAEGHISERASEAVNEMQSDTGVQSISTASSVAFADKTEVLVQQPETTTAIVTSQTTVLPQEESLKTLDTDATSSLQKDEPSVVVTDAQPNESLVVTTEPTVTTNEQLVVKLEEKIEHPTIQSEAQSISTHSQSNDDVEMSSLSDEVITVNDGEQRSAPLIATESSQTERVQTSSSEPVEAHAPTIEVSSTGKLEPEADRNETSNEVAHKKPDASSSSPLSTTTSNSLQTASFVQPRSSSTSSHTTSFLITFVSIVIAILVIVKI